MSTLKTVYKVGQRILTATGTITIDISSKVSACIRQHRLGTQNLWFPEPVLVHCVTLLENNELVQSGSAALRTHSFNPRDLKRKSIAHGYFYGFHNDGFLLVMFNCKLRWEDYLEALNTPVLLNIPRITCRGVIADGCKTHLTGDAIGIPQEIGPEGMESPFMTSVLYDSWDLFEDALLKQEEEDTEEREEIQEHIHAAVLDG